MKKLFPYSLAALLILAVALAGCGGGNGGSGGGGDSIGLTKYTESVIQGTPTKQINGSEFSAKAIDTSSLADFINIIFNDPNEPGNIVKETQKMDALITEINSRVNNQNQSTSPNVRVIPNNSGAVTLPFFGNTVPIDYLVQLYIGSDGQSQYAGYKKSATGETVILFMVGPVFRLGENMVRDHNLFYGKKSENVVDIWHAGLGVTEAGSYSHGLAGKIHIEGIDKFEVVHNYKYCTLSIAGIPKGYFLFRMRESSITSTGLLGLAGLYDYASGNYTLLGSKELPNLDDRIAITDTEFNKPTDLSDTTWEEMTNFVSTIADPDDNPNPTTTTDFNNTFLSSAFK